MEPRTFARDVQKALEKADATKTWLLEAWEWSVHNLKAIHEINPTWSQAKFEADLKRLYGRNPYIYSLAIKKLGGGNVRLGKKIFSVLGIKKAAVMTDRLNKKDFESFMKQVDEKTKDREIIAAANNVLSLKKLTSRRKEKVYVLRKQYEQLLEENKKLRQEVREYKRLIQNLKRTVLNVS